MGVSLADNVDSKAFSSANICDTCDVLLTDSRARSDFLCAKNVATPKVEAGQKKPRRSAGLRAGRGGAGGMDTLTTVLDALLASAVADNNTTAVGVSMGDRSDNANQARSRGRAWQARTLRFGKMLRALKTGTRRSGDGLDKMRLHSKMLRAWMVTLLAFRKKMYTKS